MNISENKPANKKKLVRTAAVILLLLTAAAIAENIWISFLKNTQIRM